MALWPTDVCRRGYADAEIEAVFAKYDADGDSGLNLNEQSRMQRDLDEQKVNTSSAHVIRLLLLSSDSRFQLIYSYADNLLMVYFFRYTSVSRQCPKGQWKK